MNDSVGQAVPQPAPDTSTRAFVKLAWPLFIANLAVVGNGTIDTIMAGRLSATDLAAVAVGSSIYVSVYIGLMGVLQALSPIAGHHYGAQRWRAIGDDLQQALWLALFLALAGLPILLAADTWVGLARVNTEVATISTTYRFALRGYKNTFWPMVNYGVSLWGVGLIGGYWIALTETPLGPPRGALGFWEAATVALGIAAVALAWLAAAVASRRAQQA